MRDVPVESGAGKYKCLDCESKGKSVTRYVGYKEATRASRPRCNGCGSTRLELIPKKNKEDAE